jgi:hypothetical protein
MPDAPFPGLFFRLLSAVAGAPDRLIPILPNRATGPAMQPLFCSPKTAKTVDESLTVALARGAGPSSGSACNRSGARVLESARQRREGASPLSLSQDLKTTGAIGRSNARRAWTGPPEGPFDRFYPRPPPAPVRDRRTHLYPPFTTASAPSLPGSACWRIVVGRNSVRARRCLRHLLEDGVANAEAPSSNEGLIRRVFEFARSLASARIGLAVSVPVAPTTETSAEYCLTGH